MAGVTSEQNEKLNVEPNLVPFIDLLSTLVLFLLVTAVWLQISAIPAAIDSKGRSTASVAPQERLTIHLSSQGIQLTWPAKAAGRFPGSVRKTSDGYDNEKLISILKKALAMQGMFSSVAVSSDDTVEYASVIQAIDSVKAAGVASLALSVN